MDLVKGATRKTLIIYIHREDSPRIVIIERNNNECTIDEESLIKRIKGRVHEVGCGASEILTCRCFDAIAQNTPSNLMFVHYKQADTLQKMLAKYHCPHLVKKDLPIAENIANNKKKI